MQTRTTLTAAIAAALALSFALPVAAQSLGSGGSSMREQREKRMKELRGESTQDEDAQKGKGKKETAATPAEAPRYPNAKRKEPKVSTTRDGAAKLQLMVDAFNKKDLENMNIVELAALSAQLIRLARDQLSEIDRLKISAKRPR